MAKAICPQTPFHRIVASSGCSNSLWSRSTKILIIGVATWLTYVLYSGDVDHHARFKRVPSRIFVRLVFVAYMIVYVLDQSYHHK